MSVEIVNLTEHLVKAVVDELIEIWPHPAHRELFSEPHTRQKLITQVLNESRSHYVVLPNVDKPLIHKPLIHTDSSLFLTEERIRIEGLVYGKLAQIVKEKAAIRQRLDALYHTSEPNPSSWFD